MRAVLNGQALLLHVLDQTAGALHFPLQLLDNGVLAQLREDGQVAFVMVDEVAPLLDAQQLRLLFRRCLACPPLVSLDVKRRVLVNFTRLKQLVGVEGPDERLNTLVGAPLVYRLLRDIGTALVEVVEEAATLEVKHRLMRLPPEDLALNLAEQLHQFVLKFLVAFQIPTEAFYVKFCRSLSRF